MSPRPSPSRAGNVIGRAEVALLVATAESLTRPVFAIADSKVGTASPLWAGGWIAGAVHHGLYILVRDLLPTVGNEVVQILPGWWFESLWLIYWLTHSSVSSEGRGL